MIRRLAKEESGYSLVEVIISIFLLTAAIIPMVGMFDMGLNASMKGGNYDRARALANASLEKVQGLSYADAQANYRPVNATPTAGTAVSCNSGIYTCNVTTTYMNNNFSPSSASTTKMQVQVTVAWEGNNYTTTGLKAR